MFLRISLIFGLLILSIKPVYCIAYYGTGANAPVTNYSSGSGVKTYYGSSAPTYYGTGNNAPNTNYGTGRVSSTYYGTGKNAPKINYGCGLSPLVPIVLVPMKPIVPATAYGTGGKTPSTNYGTGGLSPMTPVTKFTTKSTTTYYGTSEQPNKYTSYAQ